MDFGEYIMKSFTYLGSKSISFFQRLLLILFTILSIMENFLVYLTGTNIGRFTFILTLSIIVIGLVFDLALLKSNGELAFLFLLICSLFIWKFSYSIINIVALGIIFFSFSPEKVLKVFRWIMLILIIMGIISSLTGIAPMYDSITGVFTLGFLNENGLGSAIEILAILIMFDYSKEDKLEISFSIYKWLIYLFVLLINFFFLNDSTAVLTMFIFLIYVVFLRVIKKSRFLKFVILVTPMLLSYISVWLGFHFNASSSWMLKLNSMLTFRPSIWNYYCNRVQLSLLSSNYFNTQEEYVRFFNGALDGSYIYALISMGWLYLILIVLGCTLCNYKLLKNRKYELLGFIFVMEIAGFSEGILTNIWLGCSFIYIILSYNPKWISGV